MVEKIDAEPSPHYIISGDVSLPCRGLASVAATDSDLSDCQCPPLLLSSDGNCEDWHVIDSGENIHFNHSLTS
jgi:hypothetical protein